MLTEQQIALGHGRARVSDLAAIAGEDDRDGHDPLGVWMRYMGMVPDAEDNADMRRGRRMEKALAIWHAEDTGLHARPSECFAHPVYPICGTPDRLAFKAQPDFGVWAPGRVLPDEGWECKSVRWKRRGLFGEPGTGDVPREFQIQCSGYLALMPDLPAWKLLADLGEDDPRTDERGYALYVIPRDEELIGLLLDLTAKFVTDHVLAKKSPEQWSGASVHTYLKKQYPANTTTMIDPTDEVIDIARQLVAARSSVDTASDVVEALENRLKASTGEAEGIKGILTWRKAKDSVSINWEAVAQTLRRTLKVYCDEQALQDLWVAATTTESTIKAGSRRLLFNPRAEILDLTRGVIA